MLPSCKPRASTGTPLGDYPPRALPSQRKLVGGRAVHRVAGNRDVPRLPLLLQGGLLHDTLHDLASHVLRSPPLLFFPLGDFHSGRLPGGASDPIRVPKARVKPRTATLSSRSRIVGAKWRIVAIPESREPPVDALHENRVSLDRGPQGLRTDLRSSTRRRPLGSPSAGARGRIADTCIQRTNIGRPWDHYG